MSEDPIGFGAGDGNLYRYTGNHPDISYDPFGLEEMEAKDFRYRQLTLADFREVSENSSIYFYTRTILWADPVPVTFEVKKFRDADAAKKEQEALLENLRLTAMNERQAAQLFDNFHGTNLDENAAGHVCLVIARFQAKKIDQSITAVFEHSLSYNNRLMTSSLARPQLDRILHHEQGHFDITYVHALALRAEFRNLRASVITKAEDVKDAKSKAEDMLKTFAATRVNGAERWNSMIHGRYDNATGGGSKPRQQHSWDNLIRNAINGKDAEDPNDFYPEGWKRGS